jgi:large subunit ribosomal protein L23
MPDLYQTIVRPVITEKALSDSTGRRYTFIVHHDSNKFQIKHAVQTLFKTSEGGDITVLDVNTINVKGQTKRFRTAKGASVGKSPNFKKAIVTLAEGQTIQLFEGV